MAVDPQSQDGKIIRQLTPLNLLSMEKFERLCEQVSVEMVDKKTFLFKRNDTEAHLIYLMKGTVTLLSNDLEVEVIKAGSDSANFAIAHQLPRKIGAYAQTPVHFLRINPEILDELSKNIPNTEPQENKDMIVDEPESDDDWMTILLESPLFRALPPANLQQIIINLEPIIVEKDDFIIKQGDEADYYYLIEKGLCLVSYQTEEGKQNNIAQLKPQDTFGEDSIISGKPRNVSIIALTKVALFRIDKQNFIDLIQKPALHFIEHVDVTEKLDQGAILIDVREAEDYKAHHLPRSINTPFLKLRNQIKFFEEDKNIILVCNNQDVSSAAAFLLLRNNFTALIVKGGMENEPKNQESKPKASQPIAEQSEPIKAVENPQQQANVSDLSNDELMVALQKENESLKLTVKTLQAEKNELEKNYRALYKHAGKLKAILDSKK